MNVEQKIQFPTVVAKKKWIRSNYQLNSWEFNHSTVMNIKIFNHMVYGNYVNIYLKRYCFFHKNV